jgi:FKBP-type peptidyl-prolyl cis-trans isomerase FkpA
MKNSIKILFVLLLATGTMSCLKSNPYDVYDAKAIFEEEAPILKTYVETTESLEGAKLDTLTGIWYKIIEEGVSPTEEGYYTYKLNSAGYVEAPRITVKYEGKLVSTGVVFDKSDKDEGLENSLGGLIDGWKIAFLPKTLKDKDNKVYKMQDLIGLPGLTELGLQKGSKMRLILPSPYGYQNREQPKIPANSPLDFTIEVLKIVPPQG